MSHFLILMLVFAQTAPVADPLGERVCGPRCVQYVLNTYGRTEDLISLVKEIQWPDTNRGASLQSLQLALTNRGVTVKPFKIAPYVLFSAEQPAIVHLNRGGNSDGHFVVWLPSSTTDRIDIWDGLRGRRSMTPQEFAESSSGFILLTSAAPGIDEPHLTHLPWRTRMAANPYFQLGCGLSFVFALIAIYGNGWFRKTLSEQVAPWGKQIES